jgi:hypothetical protein
MADLGVELWVMCSLLFLFLFSDGNSQDLNRVLLGAVLAGSCCAISGCVTVCDHFWK